MEQHKKAVADIAAKVASFHKRKVPFRVYHESTNSTRHIQHDPRKVVNTGPLSHIISINTEKQVALVEPNVPMDTFVKATLERGFVPQVVPEFPAITVGGAFSGTAAESSSFKYGYFDQSVNWIEVVLADGNIIKASPVENSDLFYGAIGACGTLGVTTLFEIKLISSGKFVELTYLPVHSFSDAVARMDACIAECWDYVDGIMYSGNMGVIVVGRITDRRTTGLPVVKFTRARDKWYFLHAHSQAAHLRNTICTTCYFGDARPARLSEKASELVPLYDYFFRYDRGCFWMGSYGWPPWCINMLPGRLLFNRLSHTKINYKLMHHSRRYQSFIIQDLAIPRVNAQQFLEWTEESLALFPLWLCPIRAETKAPLHNANRPPAVADTAPTASGPDSTTEDAQTGQPGPDYVLNVGLWGVNNSSWPHLKNNIGPEHYPAWVADNRAVEAKVKELGGLKWLYAHNFYTEDDFWSIYDKEKYDGLRAKWGAESMPSIWDKVRRRDFEYLEGSFAKALVLTVLGQDHLLKKRKEEEEKKKKKKKKK
ncbi:hypothetical protein H2203_002857 [Taxawa tesnikishii (nom. ined.)]|nr:hypothetical protein H2203_002857 [Dothideales sp. JES 119]